MREKIRRHIAWLESMIGQSRTAEDLELLWRQAVEQRHYFQHERLVHLLVTIAMGFFLMLCIYLLTLSATPVTAGLVLVTAVLEIAYIVHYYHLENGVQRIYEAELRLLARSGSYNEALQEEARQAD